MKPNSWAVMFKDPKDTEWLYTKWFPSVNITHLNGKMLDPENQFDMGQVRASHEATMVLRNSGERLDVTTRHVYKKSFEGKTGNTFKFEGKQE
tara:strand:+ start:1142 stop:1420 length:279 start_codon:yes stop_codon:yes gene_type:complete